MIVPSDRVSAIMAKEAITESDILGDVCEYLMDNGYFFWRTNNGAVYDTRKRSFRHLPRFARRGVPDVSLVHNGTFIGLEVKKEGGKIRKEQEQFRDDIQAHGGVYFIVHSEKELDTLLRARGFYPRQ